MGAECATWLEDCCGDRYKGGRNGLIEGGKEVKQLHEILNEIDQSLEFDELSFHKIDITNYVKQLHENEEINSQKNSIGGSNETEMTLHDFTEIYEVLISGEGTYEYHT